MTTRRTRLAIAGTLLGATALVGAAARGGRPPAPVPAAGAAFTAPAAGAVKFSGHLDRTSVLRSGDGLVRMELVMGAKADPERSTVRRPTDLVIVLDRSGSMMGEKIEHARAAVRELVRQLGPEDRFALVTYANTATLTIPFTSADDRARATWLAAADAIVADGGTNISGGLDLGLAVLEGARGSGRAARAILISDGLANQGDPTPEGLRQRASRAVRGEYVFSTVGVGADFNESLMTALADAGTGNYYYLRGAEDLAAVFAREFDAARMTVASGLAVEIDPGDGVQVVDAGGYPLEHVGGRVLFRPGSLFAGQERRVWVTLVVPHDAVGERGLGRFALAYGEGSGRTTLALAETPRVACVAGEDDFYASIDGPTWARSIVVDAYNKMQNEVAGEVKAGRRDAAIERLREFKDEAAAMNARVNAPEVSAQLDDADRLEREVAAAFEGADQAAKQNELGKAKGAAAVDARRVGAKK